MKFAVAKIQGGERYPDIRGMVVFEQKKRGVLITARICNLPLTENGIFGFHIHEGNNCTGENFENTKGHYNPKNTMHPKHAGDLPPLFANEGRAYLSFETDRFRLNEIICKTVVIHDGSDDFKTQPSGDSGEKIGCGVINVLK